MLIQRAPVFVPGAHREHSARLSVQIQLMSAFLVQEELSVVSGNPYALVVVQEHSQISRDLFSAKVVPLELSAQNLTQVQRSSAWIVPWVLVAQAEVASARIAYPVHSQIERDQRAAHLALRELLALLVPLVLSPAMSVELAPLLISKGHFHAEVVELEHSARKLVLYLLLLASTAHPVHLAQVVLIAVIDVVQGSSRVSLGQLSANDVQLEHLAPLLQQNHPTSASAVRLELSAGMVPMFVLSVELERSATVIERLLAEAALVGRLAELLGRLRGTHVNHVRWEPSASIGQLLVLLVTRVVTLTNLGPHHAPDVQQERLAQLQGSTRNCQRCGPGTFAEQVRSRSCTSCPAGTFSLDEASETSSSCQDCPAGSFSAAGSELAALVLLAPSALSSVRHLRMFANRVPLEPVTSAEAGSASEM
ncbi:Tyrosine-protein kinase ephrin type A/B receptor-like protein [Gracilaria domingensis]|nr:Tyrosine-protein kinase ephrin type A/B receptor-like protein [Gracilaria domingensis]